MEPIAKIRFIVAVGVSPLLMPIIVYATFAIVFGSDVSKNPVTQTNINSTTWMSYGAVLVFGGASYYWMQRNNWVSVWRYLLMGSLSGLASWILFDFVSQTLFFNLLFVAFIFAGFLMGGCFWFVAYFQPDGNHLISSRRSGRRKRRRA